MTTMEPEELARRLSRGLQRRLEQLQGVKTDQPKVTTAPMTTPTVKKD
jgi:hypothetical protein